MGQLVMFRGYGEPDDGSLYAALDMERVMLKLGFTSRPLRLRMRELGALALWAGPGTRTMEALWHSRLREADPSAVHYGQGGAPDEWYRVTPRILSTLVDLVVRRELVLAREQWDEARKAA